MVDVPYPLSRLRRLLDGVRAPKGPLYRQLANGLAELIDSGELTPGELLPPERALAQGLTISRTTVVSAYRSLADSGRVDRRQGSGTRVCRDLVRDADAGQMLLYETSKPVFLQRQVDTIDLVSASLPALDIVADMMSALTKDDCLRLTRAKHDRYHIWGLALLRERIARWYSNHGSPTAPEEVLVTSGAQHALELITRACLQPGDSVITEDPTYRGALDLFERAGARVHQIHVDEHGVDVEALAQRVEQYAPRLIYLQPGLHNPTGVTLSHNRRKRLIRLLMDSSSIIIDDTVLSLTAFEESTNSPTLFSHERLMTVGSMNKLFWGGLRLGWIRASAPAVSRLALFRESTDTGTSLIAQEIGARLFDHVEEASAERRHQLPLGLDALISLLNAHLPNWTWGRPAGGTGLWVRMPHGNATEFSHVALQYGVAVLPGANFSRSGIADACIRLPFGVPIRDLEHGIARLRMAWDSYVEHGASDTSVMSSMT